MSIKYASDIKLGERYRDEQTGYEGVATGLSFYQHACERVILETFDPVRKNVVEQVFDAPRLTHIRSGLTAVTAKTGGPRDAIPRPDGGVR